jgi:UDP-N-acetylmuramyl pentapeptide phosphotransferase/UDP-N-acetylglucosamine-1-phosphate transferase
MTVRDILWGVAALAISALGTGLARWYALHREVLDHPNERSSHASPTPRGGGAAIVGATLLLWPALAHGAGLLSLRLLVALAALLIVAAVGWLDDHDSLGVRARIVVHLLAGIVVALLAISWTGGTELQGRMALVAIALWWIFWTAAAINIVNFMDGIDALVASQCIIAFLYLTILLPTESLSRSMLMVLAGGCAGFLLWNVPPARIFLGDVGSGALGFLVALMGARVISETSYGMVETYLPLYPLFLDGTTTLIRRALRGDRVTTPHRIHLYQRMANTSLGHGRVSAAYGAVAIGGAMIGIGSDRPATWLICFYAVAVAVVGLALDRKYPITTD